MSIMGPDFNLGNLPTHSAEAIDCGTNPDLQTALTLKSRKKWEEIRFDKPYPISYVFSMPVAPNTLFTALADPTRRAIFERLCREGELNVRLLTEHSGISQPAVSKHLAALKLAGLVIDRRGGRETHYSARPQGLAPLVDWMTLYGAFWRERFARLENLLDRMDR